MKPANDFTRKQHKYMPTFAKATGKPTIYIPGYPYEDEEPMPATGFHGEQNSILYEQISSYFAMQPHIYVGVDNFIYYYREGDGHEKRRPRYLCRVRCSEISAPAGVSTPGQKVRYQRSFLSSCRIRQPMRIEAKRFVSTCKIWGSKSTSSISLRWRNPLSFAGGGGVLQAALLR